MPRDGQDTQAGNMIRAINEPDGSYFVDPMTNQAVLLTPDGRTVRDKSQDKFYADEETLKQGSGFYTFMNIVVDPSKRWVENCADCRVPMSLLRLGMDSDLRCQVESVRGMVPDEKQWPLSYKKWLQNPVVNPGAEFWYCSGCQSVWTIVQTWWTKVMIDGNQTMDFDRIGQLSTAEVRIMDEKPIEAGTPESPDATMCPSCKVWRKIENYSKTHIQHVCPKCKAVDLFKKKEGQAAPVVQEEIQTQEGE